MKVLAIPEDFRKDQYILKPILKAMFDYLGRRQANVRVCQDPLLGGVSEATKWGRIQEIIQRYPMVEIFLLVVDRDGREGRRTSLDGLEKKANDDLPPGGFRVFFAENAWQEVEVWTLAGCRDLPSKWSWAEIRAEANSKELYFEEFAKLRHLESHPGGGRKALSEEAGRNYTAIRGKCKEDVLALETRLKDWLEA